MAEPSEGSEPLADAAPPLTLYQEEFADLVARLIGMVHEINQLPGCNAQVGVSEGRNADLGRIRILIDLPPPAAASDGR